MKAEGGADVKRESSSHIVKVAELLVTIVSGK